MPTTQTTLQFCWFCLDIATVSPQIVKKLTGYTVVGYVCHRCFVQLMNGVHPSVLQQQIGQQTMPPPSRSRWSSTKQKEARLIYESALAGYSLKFTYDQALVEFIKKVIPSHKRTTSGPPDWVWYFPSEYYPIVKTMFEGHKEFKLTIVTEEEVLRKQQEQEEASRHVWAPQQYNLDQEFVKFCNLLYPLFKDEGQPNTKNPDFIINGISVDFSVALMKEWSKSVASKYYRKAAMFYHPDRNNGDGTKMSELNAVWAILKEGYYIK